MSEKITRVLLIDDDEDDFILTRELFLEIKGANYEVFWAKSYDKGLAEVKKCFHDICLIDFRLGSQNGLDLIRAIRKENSLMPAILLTGQGDKEIDLEAMKAGAADYLVKSQLEPLSLERTIRYAVEHSRAEAALRASEARFRSVVQHSSDIISILDKDLITTYTSPSIEKLFGYKCEQLNGRKFPEIIHSEDLENFTSFLIAVRNKTSAGNYPIEWRVKNQLDGNWCYVESIATNLLDDPNVSGIVVNTRNINERKSLEMQLTYQAFHDTLTNLANRGLFRDRVEHAVLRAKRQNVPVAVLFLDIDNFKNINDSFGHSAGDQLLMTLAQRLQSCVRVGDTVARLGGDEFAVLLEDNKQPENAIFVAERILEISNRPITLENREISVGVSIGIAISEMGAENANELLRNADVAMYIAKEKGKGRYVIFEREMHTKIVERLELEGDLRGAIENDEFVLNFQPIVRLANHQISGFEALVRWNHPTRGLVSPLDFIPLAEETGLIIPLGKWILREACSQIVRLQNQYEKTLTMTINVSGKQIQDPEFVASIYEILDATKALPQALILEITESVMMQDTKVMLERLHELKKIGVRLAIDDFGTGYSSLSYLQQFPIDILKIDRSFVKNVHLQAGESAVARTIVSLSETLQLSTIAEGIEHLEQLQILRDLGCEFGQGFYFAKPLTEEQIDELLSKENDVLTTHFGIPQPFFLSAQRL